MESEDDVRKLFLALSYDIFGPDYTGVLANDFLIERFLLWRGEGMVFIEALAQAVIEKFRVSRSLAVFVNEDSARGPLYENYVHPVYSGMVLVLTKRQYGFNIEGIVAGEKRNRALPDPQYQDLFNQAITGSTADTLGKVQKIWMFPLD